MVYGYIRVSTDAQDCANQKIGINELAKNLGIRVEKWIEDQGVSGMKDPKKRNLGKLMKLLKPDDHILVSEISRLSRELFTIFELLKFFSEKSIKLNTVKDNYVLDGSITSKVLAFAFGMAANIERDMISKRTIEGLQARRRAGVVLGRQLGSKSATRKLDKVEDQMKKYLSKGLSYSTIAKLLNVNRLTVSITAKARGWDECLPPERKKAIENLKGSINVKPTSALKMPVGEIMEMYREHRSMKKVAEKLDVSATCLATYLKKNGAWDALVALSDKLREENPSINRQAKELGMSKLDFRSKKKQ